MKKIIFSNIFLGILCLFSNNLLFSGNNVSGESHTNELEEEDHSESIPDIFEETHNLEKFRQAKNRSELRNFVTKRLSKKFDLLEICKEHSLDAIVMYWFALNGSNDLTNIVPLEVLETINKFRRSSFEPEFKNNFNMTLYQKCAYKVACIDLEGMPSNISSLIHALRSIIFFSQAHGSYDPKLAKLLLRLYLDDDYSPQQNKLDKCLCTAAYLGDAFNVQLLLQNGANGNFVNYYDNFYTPLAYTLITEHNYSKIKNKTPHIQLLMRNYQKIAEMLITSGAKIDHRIRNGTSGVERNITYVFMQTSNLKIFSLMEEQLADKIELADELGCNIVINAFKLGNAQFIKKLYGNPLYRNSALARTGGRTFMNLAIKYYKGYDFEELFKFLIENGEQQSFTSKVHPSFWGLVCLTNAINDFDFEYIKSIAQSGVSIHHQNPVTKTNLLITLIKRCRAEHNSKRIIKIIEFLIFNGISGFHEDATGKTALDYAMEQGLDLEIIDALIYTPLMYAINNYPNNLLGLIKLIHLISNEHKAIDFSYKDSFGRTALDYAKARGLSKDVIDALTTTPLIEIIKMASCMSSEKLAELIKLFASYGHNFEFEDTTESTALNYAAQLDLTDEVLEVLHDHTTY